MGGARSRWQREDGVNQAVPTLQTETSSHTSGMWALGIRGCVRAWNHRGILVWCTENHLRKVELETTWIWRQNKALKYQILVLWLLTTFSWSKENNLQLKIMFVMWIFSCDSGGFMSQHPWLFALQVFNFHAQQGKQGKFHFCHFTGKHFEVSHALHFGNIPKTWCSELQEHNKNMYSSFCLRIPCVMSSWSVPEIVQNPRCCPWASSGFWPLSLSHALLWAGNNCSSLTE